MQKTCSLNGYQNDTVIVTMQAIKNNFSSIFFGALCSATSIDDIAFTGTLNCPAPASLTATNINSSVNQLAGSFLCKYLRIWTGRIHFRQWHHYKSYNKPNRIDRIATFYIIYRLCQRQLYGESLSANASINFTTGPCPRCSSW